MVDTMESFFDKNKLYIKSAQHEETQKSGLNPPPIAVKNLAEQESEQWI